MMLTATETKEFIKALEKYKNVEPENLFILEPRMFRILFSEAKMDKVMELNRVSNSCEQICNLMGIKYSYQHNPYLSRIKENLIVPDWSGDFVCGYTNKELALQTTMRVLEKLRPGQTYALWHKYDFMETNKRYNRIFERNPFDELILTVNRPCISADGVFTDENTRCPYNGCWFIWYGDNLGKKKNPIIKWAKNEFMQDYYKMNALGRQEVSLYTQGGHKYFKNPVQVTVDLGRKVNIS